MRLTPAIVLCLALLGCGGGDSPIPPPPPPPPPPSSGWSITQWGSLGQEQPILPLSSPTFALPIGSASTNWISYIEYAYPLPLPPGGSISLNYTIAGTAPVFVHDSGNNPPAGPSTIRLLVHGAGFRLFSTSNPLQIGSDSLTVKLDPTLWQIVDGAGNTVTDTSVFPTILAQTTTIGFCLGGGDFACHGVAIGQGSAQITANGISVQ